MNGGLARDTHVVVAALVQREGRFLMVEERVDGALKLNQPAGHWDRGEDLLTAVRREALEESGWDVEPAGLLGVYAFDGAGLDYGFLRIAFICEARRHHPQRALDAGIERAVWLTRDEIAARRAEHRGPAVLRCVDDLLAGRRFPLDAIREL